MFCGLQNHFPSAWGWSQWVHFECLHEPIVLHWHPHISKTFKPLLPLLRFLNALIKMRCAYKSDRRKSWARLGMEKDILLVLILSLLVSTGGQYLPSHGHFKMSRPQLTWYWLMKTVHSNSEQMSLLFCCYRCCRFIKARVSSLRRIKMFITYIY